MDEDDLESYHLRIDGVYNILETLFEPHLDAVDILNESGICKIISEHNSSQIILTKQTATRQLWLALQTEGLHFSWRDGKWLTKDRRELTVELHRASEQQFRLDINFNDIYKS